MTHAFDNITLRNWRQFEMVDIPLDRQVTVLTGPNGCGKTTILNILSRHFGWNIDLVSTPFLSERERRQIRSEFGHEWIDARQAADPSRRHVGAIRYSTGDICTLHVPQSAEDQPKYSLQYMRVRLAR